MINIAWNGRYGGEPWGGRLGRGDVNIVILTIFTDTFNRSEPGFNWLTSANRSSYYGMQDISAAEIDDDTLVRIDNSHYDVIYTDLNQELPADYTVEFVVPHATTLSNYWGVAGRYDVDTTPIVGNRGSAGLCMFWNNGGSHSPTFNNGWFDTNTISCTVTGGFPASWDAEQDHLIKFEFNGESCIISIDDEEYGICSGLTVNNRQGTTVALVGDGNDNLMLSEVTITVAPENIIPDANKIYFTTNGQTFEPRILLSGEATVLWEFSDSSTSNSLSPDKDFGSAGLRRHSLTVTPWSALEYLNLGYDGSDDGQNYTDASHHRDNQNILKIRGLQNAANLKRLYVSRNERLRNLALPVGIEIFESYYSGLQQVSFAGSNIRRLCLENVALQHDVLNLTGLPDLEDLRAARNLYKQINFGEVKPNLWHICVVENSQMDTDGFTTNRGQGLDFRDYTALRDVWFWQCNQAGDLILRGAVEDVQVTNNQITSIDVTGCSGLRILYAQHNALTETAVNTLLTTINSFNTSDGVIDISDNAAPSGAGLTAITALEARNWTVTYDG